LSDSVIGVISTEANDALFAIFFREDGGMDGNCSTMALGLPSLLGLTIEELLLWRVISNGPACDNLF